MGRKRQHNKHLPQHVYLRRGRYQLRYKDGHAQTFDTLDECIRAWAVEYGGTGSDLIRDIIIDYRANVLPIKAAKTKREYDAALTRLSGVFGHMRLCDLRPMHVYGYQARRPDIAGNRDIAVLSVLCGHGVKAGHADHNICKDVRRNPERPRRRYVNDEDFLMVYELAPGYIKNAMWLTLMTGMRLGDIFRIGPDNLTPDGFQYTQGKTGRKILIEWTDALRNVAKRPTVSYSGFTTAWQRVMKKAAQNGLQERFTFHDLRAKSGSEATDWRKLGHTDRKTFERIYNRKPVKVRI